MSNHLRHMAMRQREFMELVGQSIFVHNPTQIDLYYSLMEEEAGEFFDAVSLSEPIEDRLKEAADVLVTTLGYIQSYGIDPEALMKIVQSHNKIKTFYVAEPIIGKVQKSVASEQAKPKMMQAIQDLFAKVGKK
tara:strand:+ start:281 stop:682 length:402 start_codon:yes stop_codon:yes gene_type:complete